MTSENEVLEYTDIEKLIPHRAPFLLIDKLTNAVPGESAIGIKAVSGGESYFMGHFPGNPVMPGVLIVEAMAQVAACVASLTIEDEKKDTLVFFATIDKTRFRQPVRPGDLLMLDVQKTAAKANLWKFSGKAIVDGKIVAHAEFSAMIVESDK
jgi:3-hydroxyacyl-[acyl-carrier-protein] dehydratase